MLDNAASLTWVTQRRGRVSGCRSRPLSWLEEHGLPWPELSLELADPNTSEVQAVIDAAWPRGIQEGYSQPVALLLNESPETEVRVAEAGYRFFTSIEALRTYIEHEIEHAPTRIMEALVA